MSVKNFACSCGGGLGNIGLPSCVKRPGLIKKDIFFNTYATDGTRNSIKITDFVDGVLPASFLLAKLTDPDPSKRWYITPDEYEEADPTRTDKTTQESATGTIKILRKGQRNRSFQLWEVPDSWASQLNRATCSEVSVHSIDEAGCLIGEVNEDGTEFFGLPINKNTLYAEPFEATPTVDAYTMVTYQISRLSEEGSYLTISKDQLEDDLRQARSLIGVDLTQNFTDPVPPATEPVNPNTNTEIFINAFNCTLGTFGDYHALQAATDVSDWKVFTSPGTAGTEINVVAVEEYEKGKYKLTLDADVATKVYVSFVKVKQSIADFGYVADQVTITKP